MSANANIQLPFDKSHAFVVGINAYEHVSRLTTAVNDANGIAERLAEKHGYHVHGPFLDATKGDLLRLFTEVIPEVVGENDRVVFYFAGHGIALDGEDGPNGYLVPADARQGNRDTLIPMDDLHQMLHALPCRHGLLVLDCCFSGAFKWSSGFRDVVMDLPNVIYEERFWRYCKDPAWQVITSSAYDQKAVDIITNQTLGMREEGSGFHSPFANALFDALEGKGDVIPSDTGDGVITASELYAYLRDVVETETTENVKRQSPSMFNLSRHDKGEYIFLSPNHRFNLPPTPDRNPFMGLKSYDEDDTHLFYGRDRAIDALMEMVSTHPLMVVSGASGTGKSSVIKAGVLPRLRKQGYKILPVIRPGKEPLQILLEEIPDPDKMLGGGKTALVIDQYEELITQCLDPEERHSFEQQLASWLNAYRDLRILLSIRSDFEPQFESEALASWWKKGRYVVPSFSLEEYREIITKPATQAVLFYEPVDLVDKLEAEVSQAPGALPLLSFTLSELYHGYLKSGREDRALTLEDYENLGGVIGALRTRADAEYKSLDFDHQSSMRKLMLRMVSLEGGELAGKRVYSEELEFGDQAETERVERVADQLVDARLILRGKDNQGRVYVEPAHDALVRAWARLWEWIKTVGEEKITLQYKLSQAVNDYHGLLAEGSSKANNLLWNNNPRLDLLNAELKGKDHSLNRQEEDFVRKSVKRKKTRRQQLIGGLLGIMAILIGLTIYAFIQQGLAVKSAREANLATAKADSNYIVASMERIRAELKTIEADDSAKAANLSRELAEYQRQYALIQQGIAEDSAEAARIQRGIAIVARKAADDSAEVAILARNKAEESAEIAAKERDNALKSAAEARTAALAARARETYNRDNTLAFEMAYEAFHSLPMEDGNSAISEAVSVLGEILTNEKSHYYEKVFSHGSSANTVEIIPYGDAYRILTAGRDSAVVWDWEGEKIQSFSTLPNYIFDAHFAKDGNSVVTGIMADSTIILWDMNGEKVHTFKDASHSVVHLEVARNYLLSGSADFAQSLWNLTPPYDRRAEIPMPKDLSKSYYPDPNSIELYGQALSDTGIILRGISKAKFNERFPTSYINVWDHNGAKIRSLQFPKRLSGQINPLNDENIVFQIMDVDISPDGGRIMVGTANNGAQIWNSNGKEHLTLAQMEGMLHKVKILPNGAFSVNYQDNKGARNVRSEGYMTLFESGHRILIWNERGKIVKSFTEWYPKDADFTPNGDYMLVGGADGRAKLYDLSRNVNDLPHLPNNSGGLKNFSLKTFRNATGDVTFTQDNEHILIDHTLHDLPTGTKTDLKNIKGTSFRFFPTDDTVLTIIGSEVVLWNVAQQEKLVTLTGHKDEIVSAAISNDGKRILTGSKDSTAILWDHTGKQLYQYANHSAAVTALDFYPSGDTILSGSADGVIRFWNPERGDLGKLKIGGEINSIFVHPSGQKAWASIDEVRSSALPGRPTIIELITDSARITYQSILSANINYFRPFPDGYHLLVVMKEKAIIWNMPYAKTVMEVDIEDFATLSPNGKYIFSRDFINKGRIWWNPVYKEKRYWPPNIYQLTPEERKRYGLNIAR